MLENVTPTWRRVRLERMLMQLLMKLRRHPERKLI
jgi:Mrp family chromosome partitioning ATPase